MKKYLSSFVILIVMVFFSISCRTLCRDEVTDKEREKIKGEIETIVTDFFNPNTLNYNTHTGMRANKEGYVMGGDGKIQYTSYSSYNEHMKSSFAGIQRFTEARLVAMYVYVLSKTAATCTTEFKSKFLMVSGDTILNNGCWTFVFKKFDNGWKVIQENGTHIR
jgi:hypothetical protein